MPSTASNSRFRRWTQTAARSVVASLMLASVALTLAQQARTVGPWWLELSRYLPYPLLLAPGLVALASGFVLGWRWSVASLGVLALTATFGMGLAWGRPEAGELPLRFMTYNIKAYKAVRQADGFAKLTREVGAHRPDLLTVQDNQGGVARAEFALWPDLKPFGMPYAFFADQYIVASRYPLRNCVLERLDPARPTSTAARCTVDVRGEAVTVVTSHFDSPRDGLNATRRDGLEGADDWEQNHVDRLWQARLLAANLKNVRRPLILAGDLNATESSPVVRTLKLLGVRDAYSSATRGYGYSYGHALRFGFSFLRIDHILVSPEIGVAASWVGSGDASDHRPVVADLWLKRR